MILVDADLLVYAATPQLPQHAAARAWLDALAIEHGLELCSNDGDFARFQGLRWSNPLAR